MGSLIHIAEVAALLFAAYVVGWLAGYLLHRVLARPMAGTVAIARAAEVATAPSEHADALVRAPVVVPVANPAPPHIQAKVTQIEPATAVAVPDGMVPAEARTISVPRAATPVSALETLKSLSTAIPLAPINVAPIAAMPETSPPAGSSLDVSGPSPQAEAKVAPQEADAGPRVDDRAVAAASPEPILDAMPPAGARPQLPLTEPEPAAPAIPAELTAGERKVQPQPLASGVTIEAEPAAEPVLAKEPTAEPEPIVEPDATVGAEQVSAAKPAVSAEPVVVAESAWPLAMPTSQPGVAWAGEIKGREALPFERVANAASDPAAESRGGASAGLDVALLDGLADELQVEEPALPINQLDALAATTVIPSAPVAGSEIAIPATDYPAPAPVEAVVETTAMMPEPVAEPGPVSPQAARPEFDEDAAMRAIEGGWSRRATRAMSDAHELTDVSAAVSAAQMAVEQVLAANGIDPSEQGARAQAAFGKPRGLPQPRNGRRDNLKQINGLGPLDESTLNNLGVYHFDQIAAWDQKEVLWMENHAFARGRIGREDWQGQARALIDEDRARRAGS